MGVSIIDTGTPQSIMEAPLDLADIFSMLTPILGVMLGMKIDLAHITSIKNIFVLTATPMMGVGVEATCI